MATDREISEALEKLGAAVARRPLSQWERTQLATELRKATGSTQGRIKAALSRSILITEHEAGQRIAASDNTDRLMQELTSLIDGIRPK